MDFKSSGPLKFTWQRYIESDLEIMIIHYLNLSDVDVMIIHYLHLSDVDVMMINYLNLSDVDVMIIMLFLVDSDIHIAHHWDGNDIHAITGYIVTLVVGYFYYW
jgi:hypothetical protein